MKILKTKKNFKDQAEMIVLLKGNTFSKSLKAILEKGCMLFGIAASQHKIK